MFYWQKRITLGILKNIKPAFLKNTTICHRYRNFKTYSTHLSQRKMAKLYTQQENPHSLKIIASSSFYDISLDIKYVKQDLAHSRLPFHQLPLLECSEGESIFNPNASCRYLHSLTKVKQEEVLTIKQDELLEWEATKLQPQILPMLSALSQGKKQNNSLKESLATLQKLIGEQIYLLGPSPSLADIVIWSSLYPVTLDKSLKDSLSEFPTVNKWFETLCDCELLSKAALKVTGGKGIEVFKSFFENTALPPTVSSSTKPLQTNVKVEANTESTEDGPSEAEITQAKEFWLTGVDAHPKPKFTSHPILPQEGERNVLITSALPYVNNVPHLGNVVGCVLSADVYARYCRMRNYNTLYVCGTDEYGTATETKALAEGLTPQEICDKYTKIHGDIYKWFNIEFDTFGRTSTPKQKEIVQDIFWKVHKNGYLLEDSIDQLRCEKCEKFLADRFVEGNCPFCNYEDARGDQCDACGKLVNAVELKNPRCKQCGCSPVIKTSQHVFINLPKIEPKLKEWLKTSETGNWTVNARNITRSWITEGLRQRCITRDLKWGVPVPLEGYTGKVFYVWFDAPIGYISITANYTSEWEKWWKNPDQVELVQFMAKDNVPFHTVLFPSSLLAADDNFTILSSISATEYLNYEEDKFSKSRGVGVFGDHAESTGIPADIYRFYLLYIRPESQDSAFQWSDFILKNNSELLNNLGNFVNRALMFLKNNFGSTIPAPVMAEDDYTLVAAVNKELAQYNAYLENMKLREGLRCILNISRLGNQYMQSNKPWVLAKGSEKDKERAGTVIGVACNISAIICILIKPYMPMVSQQLQSQLALPNTCLAIPTKVVPLLGDSHVIGTPAPLFQKLDPALGEELKERFAGRKDEPKKTDDKKRVAPSKAQTTAPAASPEKVAELEKLVAAQGDVVRKAKSERASKDVIDTEVKKLLELKKQLALAQGKDTPAPPAKGKKKNK